ncbi:zinc-ribbon and DUF3426 domain-containing protein [Aquabacterium sp. OR-4]|uniref:zinc-ribbon and DUF3426 domain-containing protein n=1 Tax=Aquabacterium sp. OR-4 TaxID=2978127 RepID=UPI0021B40703|nr:zinc-ribbon and DUF3426 domain-containing protein [Aquabacterium sp. OR-4]MDT7834390.1 zinc-ribbon and DUF3426 domain-containing protein [Aquabacterium sp. OR-4]
MSLASRCPTCGTVFRVVHDQLRVSEGWVRCGRCAGVFNAADDLIDMATGQPVPPQAAAARPLPSAAPAEAPDLAERWDEAPLSPPISPQAAAQAAPPALPRDLPNGADDALAHLDALGSTVDPLPGLLLRTPSREPVDAPAAAGAPAPAAPASAPATATAEPALEASAQQAADAAPPPSAEAPSPDLAAAPDSPPAIPPHSHPDAPAATRVAAHDPGLPGRLARQDDTPADTPSAPVADGLAATLADPAHAAAPALAAMAAFPQPPAAPPEPTLEFVRVAERAALWRRKPVRVAASVAAALLLLLALAQATLLWRDTLAARHPHWAGPLQRLCGLAGCTLQPVQRIGAFSVDASGMARLEAATPEGAQYRFSVSLRNRADLALAMPAVELSLTDASGRLVVRKVLRAAELGAPQALVAAGQELSLQALVATGGQSIDGYTVELFYP